MKDPRGNDITKYGHWKDHPHYPAEDWKYEVQNDITRQGYWGWVKTQLDSEQDNNQD